MKKSELRALIREVLKEELLREKNETIIDEKGFLSAASRVISDKLNGKTLVDKETGDTVATVPSLNNLSRFTTKVADGKEYSYFLAKDVPTTTKLSDELLTALRELAKLCILPSNIDLAGAEVELVYVKNREHVLKNVLEKAKSSYDFITIDCPPSLGLLTINALASADTVIIPIQSEYYALEGLSQLMNTIKLVVKHLNPTLKIEGVVLTMNDNRAIISRQISAEIKKFFGKRVFETAIPRNIRLAEAPSHGVPIMLHDTKCSGAKAYLALTEEFLERQSSKKN